MGGSFFMLAVLGFLRLLELRRHSLSAESPAMRQDFVSLCPSGFPLPSAGKPAAVSRILPGPRPRSRGGTSVQWRLPAKFPAASARLLASILPSAQFRKNNPPSRFPRVPLVRARPAPAVSGHAPALLASSPPRPSVLFQRKAPRADSTLRARFESPRFHASSPAAAQSQTAPAAFARACARRGAWTGFPHRAPSKFARPIRAPLPRATRSVSPGATASSPVFLPVCRARSKGWSPVRAAPPPRHRSNSNALPLPAPALSARV